MDEIYGTEHGDVEHKLFEWFCSARANSIAVDGRTVNRKAIHVSLFTKVSFKNLVRNEWVWAVFGHKNQ
jgi:hypothetical protein